MNHSIDLMSDFSERVHYNNPDMAVYANTGKLSVNRGLGLPSHWYDDLEFSILLSGHMSYNINRKTILIEKGNGLFINSRQLHCNFFVDGTDCEYICVLLHPALICTNPYIEDNFVTPVTLNNSLTHMDLNKDIPWQAEILGNIHNIYKLFEKDDKTAALKTQSDFYRIWSILFEHMPGIAFVPSKAPKILPQIAPVVSLSPSWFTDMISAFLESASFKAQ